MFTLKAGNINHNIHMHSWICLPCWDVRTHPLEARTTCLSGSQIFDPLGLWVIVTHKQKTTTRNHCVFLSKAGTLWKWYFTRLPCGLQRPNSYIYFWSANPQVVSTNPEEPGAPEFVGGAGGMLVISVGPQTILNQLWTFSNQIYLPQQNTPWGHKVDLQTSLLTSRAQLSIEQGQLIYDASEVMRKTSPTWPGDAVQP